MSVLAVTHVGVDAGHVVEERKQQDKDFLKVRSRPSRLEDHVCFSVELESHIKIGGLATAKAFTMITQAQIVQQNSGQAGLALLGGKIHTTVIVVGWKVKGVVVDH